MLLNSNKFIRFLSDPYDYKGRPIIHDSDNKEITASPVEHVQIQIKDNHQPKRKILRRFSSKAEQKIDNLEQEAQRVSDILQKPIFTSIKSLHEDDLNKQDIVISSISQHTTIETGLTFHRDIKAGRQRFRWNLLFNLLVWLIVPFPFWMPFISNTLAYYIIPSIQAVFVLMWTSTYTFFHIY